MSKRKRTSEIEKWIKEDRGSGIGINYKYSRCFLSRSFNWFGRNKTGSKHEFL